MLRAGDGEYSGAKTRSMSAAYCNAIFASLLAKYWLGTTAPSGISWSGQRSEEHTSELQSLMRISYDVFCLKKKRQNIKKVKDKNNRNTTIMTKLLTNTQRTVKNNRTGIYA